MKYFFTLLFISFYAVVSYGQLPDEFIAPDFTVTDINGNEHNLYEKLDEGKTVILDIFTTWCGPCWEIHEQQVLKNIWEERGPDGTDEVFIFSIENDLSTDMDDILGIGQNTQGDYTEGITFPIIDETVPGSEPGFGSIGCDYFVIGFPTFYFVCPDRSVTEINWQLLAAEYANIIASCPGVQGDNNLRVTEYSGVEGTICEAIDFVPSVSFQNLGSQMVTAATLELTINGTTQQFNWEGELNTFQFGELTFPSITASNTDILIEIVDVNDQLDDFPDNNTLETSILAPNLTAIDTVTIEIMTDGFGAETYWAVLDDNNEVVAEGGNLAVGLDVNLTTLGAYYPPSHPDSYEGNTLYTIDVHLPANGCYRLVIADYFEDGICCNFDGGFFNVISRDNGVLVEGIGEFGHLSENPFAFSSTVSIEDVFTAEINIMPNPVVDDLIIEIPHDSAPTQSILLFDVQGRNILTTKAANTGNQINLDMSSLHAGVYLLQVTFEDGTAARRKVFKQ